MPRNVHTTNYMLNPLSNTVTSKYCGLWITDGLLAETFRSFCHSHQRRYGSNVPGPLEARRRAAKRKNTSLAHVGGAGGLPVYDSSVIFGAGTKHQWWEKFELRPEAQVAREDSQHDQGLVGEAAWLPSWLSGSQSSDIPCLDELAEVDGTRQQDSKQNTAESISDTSAHFRDCILGSENLESVHSVVKNTTLNLRQHPELSEFAFKHLVRICTQLGDYDELAKVMYDPLVHPPGTSNNLFFIQHLTSNRLTRKSWESNLFPSLLKAIELGLVPAVDIEQIMKLIPAVHKSISGSRVVYRIKVEQYEILTAIKHSRVLTLDDLDAGFLCKLCKQVLETKVTGITPSLLLKLRRYWTLPEFEFDSRMAVGWVHGLDDDINTPASQQFRDWLTSFPADTQHKIIVRTTLKLVEDAQTRRNMAQAALERWAMILPYISSEELDSVLGNSSTWSEPFVARCGLTKAQQIVSITWILSTLWVDHVDPGLHFLSTGLRDRFLELFASIDNPVSVGHLGGFVGTLNKLPLPERNLVFQFLQYFTDDGLTKMLGHGRYTKKYKSYIQQEYAELQDSHFVRGASRYTPRIVTALAESINTDLAQFEAMAKTLILKSSENCRIVRELIRYNKTLVFALGQSWPAAIAKHNYESREQEHNPAAILHMVEKLTMTFAISPAVSRRVAFKHVYQMYKFLHRVGGPINPIIGRALFHAGVTRYGEDGAPNDQVQWCFAKVRELEGVQAAHELLSNTLTRTRFVEDYLLAHGDEDLIPVAQAFCTVEDAPEWDVD